MLQPVLVCYVKSVVRKIVEYLRKADALLLSPLISLPILSVNAEPPVSRLPTTRRLFARFFSIELAYTLGPPLNHSFLSLKYHRLHICKHFCGICFSPITER